MPAKLDKCVDDVKAKGDGVDNPWAVCNASLGNKTKEQINANRQRPSFNPPIIKGKVEPQVNKTTKGIGGPNLNKKSFLWKDILDAQLKRNVKEPNL